MIGQPFGYGTPPRPFNTGAPGVSALAVLGEDSPPVLGLCRLGEGAPAGSLVGHLVTGTHGLYQHSAVSVP